MNMEPKSNFFIFNFQFWGAKLQLLDSLIYHYCYYCIFIVIITKIDTDSRLGIVSEPSTAQRVTEILHIDKEKWKEYTKKLTV